jgi:hypothetical protein
MRHSLALLTSFGVALVAAQAVPVERSNPPVRGDLVAPPAVREVLRSGCYDCHSNQTRWPWYSALAPVSWLIQRDVMVGRRRLNFSEWTEYASDPETAAQKLRRIAESVEDGNMAPLHYRALHPGAQLTRAERSLLAGWASEAARRTSSPPRDGKEASR